jgi:hypothetical protein
MSTITIGNGIANAVTYTADTTGNLVFTAAGGVVNASSMTGAASIPSGTTAQRPANLVNGMIRYNSTNNVCETYINNIWIAFP